MLAVTGSKPDAHVRFFFLAFGALGSKSQRAQKGGFCAAALEEVASLGVCRGSLNFHFLSLRVLQFWSNIYACWRSRFRNPRCTCGFFSLAFSALGSKPQRGQKGELCVAALAAVASLGVCHGSLVFRFSSMRVLRFWSNLYACWRLRVQTPMRTCDFYSWLLVLWGVSHSARKKAGFVRPHWRRLRVWGFAAGRLFFIFLSLRVLWF